MEHFDPYTEAAVTAAWRASFAGMHGAVSDRVAVD
jgi:hypothetical protein